MTTQTTPRCGGAGELVEQISPSGVDHRDAAFETREVPCPGCPDCRTACANCGATWNELCEHEGCLVCAEYGACDRTLYYEAAIADHDLFDRDA